MGHQLIARPLTPTMGGNNEALCNKCGKCCELFGSGYACPQFNVKTNRCNNYKNRRNLFPCRYAEDVVDKLPLDCPFVTGCQPEKVDYAVLKPYHSAPLSIRRHVDRKVKEYLRERKGRKAS